MSHKNNDNDDHLVTIHWSALVPDIHVAHVVTVTCTTHLYKCTPSGQCPSHRWDTRSQIRFRHDLRNMTNCIGLAINLLRRLTNQAFVGCDIKGPTLNTCQCQCLSTWYHMTASCGPCPCPERSELFSWHEKVLYNRKLVLMLWLISEWQVSNVFSVSYCSNLLETWGLRLETFFCMAYSHLSHIQ